MIHCKLQFIQRYEASICHISQKIRHVIFSEDDFFILIPLLFDSGFLTCYGCIAPVTREEAMLWRAALHPTGTRKHAGRIVARCLAGSLPYSARTCELSTLAYGHGRMLKKLVGQAQEITYYCLEIYDSYEGYWGTYVSGDQKPHSKTGRIRKAIRVGLLLRDIHGETCTPSLYLAGTQQLDLHGARS